MKLIIFSIIICYSSISFATINLDLQYKNSENGKTAIYKSNNEPFSDEREEYKIPNENKNYPITVTEKNPNFFNENPEASKNKVNIEIKL